MTSRLMMLPEDLREEMAASERERFSSIRC
jgi:hypothetical protein